MATPSPSELRARELFSKIPCTPPDAIFADKEGHVDNETTPKLFVGATLAERFHIVKYIESGAFGKSFFILLSTLALEQRVMYTNEQVVVGLERTTRAPIQPSTCVSVELMSSSPGYRYLSRPSAPQAIAQALLIHNHMNTW